MSNIKTIISDFADAVSSIGNPDRLFEFIRDEGVSYKSAALPDTLERGRPKQCFNNAADLAIEHTGLLYVEGFAVHNDVGFPIHHAWVIDRDNNVIDNTWGSPEDCAYFGILVEREVLIERLLETGVYGVLLNKRGTLDLDYVAKQFNWSPTDKCAKPVENIQNTLTI